MVAFSSSDGEDFEAIVEKLIDVMHELYVKANACNFILVDVPPINLSPGGKIGAYALPSHSLPRKDIILTIFTPVLGQNSAYLPDRVEAWNAELLDQALAFADSTKTFASISFFSAHYVLHTILANPVVHSFLESDLEVGGSIWMDVLHLTLKVHEIVANRMCAVLDIIAPLARQAEQAGNDNTPE